MTEDTKMLDWLEKHFLTISHGRATCSVDMGGNDVSLNYTDKGGSRGKRIQARSIREAIRAAQKLNL